jgi:CubicO group peptidase (beta-lactamase class C family)
VAPGWERVADVFAQNFDRELELGSACCVYFEGRPVVDLWGGCADDRTGRGWEEDTVVGAFSTTKGATAICAHMLAERGLLDLDARVTDYWPEYGAAGKGATLVRWLLSHKAGVPAVDAELTIEEVCAWEPAIRALETQKPFWPPGEQYLYHAQSFGFLVGEVVRRITGQTLGGFFAHEVAGPLVLNAWIGTPAGVEPRVAHLVLNPPPAHPEATLLANLERAGVDQASVPAVLAIVNAFGADPLVPRTSNFGGAFPDGLLALDSRLVRAAELPGSNIVTDARSLARMYAATVGKVDGVRLLQPETVEAMCLVQTAGTPLHGAPEGLAAFADLFEVQFGLGVMRPVRQAPLLGPGSFGHGGAGGSLGFADPEAGIGFGYVMNRLVTGGTDRRAAVLVAAVRDCLEAL